MNYEEQISVNYDVSRLAVKVYSPHWYDHIRENRLIPIMKFVIPPLLALFAYLEERYEVVRSVWSTSRPIEGDEARYLGLAKFNAFRCITYTLICRRDVKVMEVMP